MGSSVSLFALMLGLAVSGLLYPAMAQVADSQDKAQIRFDAKQRRPVSIVIEEGHSASGVLVGYLKGHNAKRSDAARISANDLELPADSEEAEGIVFSIVNGGGIVFEASRDQVSSSRIAGGAVTLPAVKAGRDGDEGVVRVLAGGQPIVNDIRVATVAAGGMASVRTYFSDDNAAVIMLGDHFVIIDESKVTNVGEDAVMEDCPGDGTPSSGRLLGLCIRVAWGPGKAKYSGFDPWAVGKRYSYKPESAYALRRGSGSEDDVDAIYRYSWGCGTALKVPDSCTVTIYSDGSRNYCCNAAMAALGHTVKWVSPTAHGFPNCPLSPF